MKFISYADWRKSELERLLASNEEIDCPQCNGSGEKDCSCTCGHEHEAECTECEGTGNAIFSDLPRTVQDRWFLGIEKYEAIVLREASQLACYVSRDVVEILVEGGFQPWMRIWKDDPKIFLLPPELRRNPSPRAVL
jgi:hypothetical protein